MGRIRPRSALAMAVVLSAACQGSPSSFPQEYLDRAEGEVAAELEAFWDAWSAPSFDEGMAFYSNRPDMTMITDGFVWESKAQVEEAYRSFFEGMDRQEVEVLTTRITALTPEVVNATQVLSVDQYFRDGTVVLDQDYTNSYTWMLEDGGWKILDYHSSLPSPAPATLKSVHLINLPPGTTESELVADLRRLNAGVWEAGYRSAGYDLWRLASSQSPESTPTGFEFIMEGLWPDQGAYDGIHESEAFLAALETLGDVFDRITPGQRYSRYVQVEVGGPGER